jgi:hypothetical protein
MSEKHDNELTHDQLDHGDLVLALGGATEANKRAGLKSYCENSRPVIWSLPVSVQLFSYS